MATKRSPKKSAWSEPLPSVPIPGPGGFALGVPPPVKNSGKQKKWRQSAQSVQTSITVFSHDIPAKSAETQRLSSTVSSSSSNNRSDVDTPTKSSPRSGVTLRIRKVKTADEDQFMLDKVSDDSDVDTIEMDIDGEDNDGSTDHSISPPLTITLPKEGGMHSRKLIAKMKIKYGENIRRSSQIW